MRRSCTRLIGVTWLSEGWKKKTLLKIQVTETAVISPTCFGIVKEIAKGTTNKTKNKKSRLHAFFCAFFLCFQTSRCWKTFFVQCKKTAKQRCENNSHSPAPFEPRPRLGLSNDTASTRKRSRSLAHNLSLSDSSVVVFVFLPSSLVSFSPLYICGFQEKAAPEKLLIRLQKAVHFQRESCLPLKLKTKQQNKKTNLLPSCIQRFLLVTCRITWQWNACVAELDVIVKLKSGNYSYAILYSIK